MKRTRFLRLAAALACILSSLGCASRTPSQIRAPRTGRSLELLRSDLEGIFSDHNLAIAQWGVKVSSLDRSETLYEKNSARLCIPASNNKILTSAAALLRLGPGFKFKTRILTDGQVAEGRLRGNLIILGSGDPSSSLFQAGDPFQVFREWAGKLKADGINAIAGDIIAYEPDYAPAMLGDGWEWNDLTEGYAAPISILQFNENLVTIEIYPGGAEGSSASARLLPLPGYMAVDCRVLTGAESSPPRIEIERTCSDEGVVVRGAVPVKAAAVVRTVAVRNPIRYYLHALRHALMDEGVDTSLCRIGKTGRLDTATLSPLWEYSSPPLSEILKPLLKMSHNLYAESVARALGLALRNEGSFASGKQIVEDTLFSMAIKKESYSYADGSGLSRLNLVSPDVLVRILGFVYRHDYFSYFYDSLPIAGVDGTLEARMKRTKAENNVHAKTGTLKNVCAISGYLHTQDGEMLAFSIIANSLLGPRGSAEAILDAALVRLANFSRK